MGQRLARSIYIVDADPAVRRALMFLLGPGNADCRCFDTIEAFAMESAGLTPGCVLLDLELQVRSGLDLGVLLKDRRMIFPIVAMSNHGDVLATVSAMRSGIAGYLHKPFDDRELAIAVDASFALIEGRSDLVGQHNQAVQRISELAPDEVLVLRGMLAAMPNDEIASILAIDPLKIRRIRARLVQELGRGRATDMLAIGCAARLAPLPSLQTWRLC
jgi:two-component system response regulator FixJ